VALGPDLPTVREWGCERHAFAGYVTGPEPPVDREQVRAELGYRDGERVCVVAVGGSAVGRPLLARVAAAFPAAARAVPGLRMVLVTGPRIDPASVPVPRGVEVLGYVPDLPRMLAACDVAVVQGGLTTTMELVAARVPFVYVPLRHHFEQQVHVPQRLARYGAGRRLDWADADPDRIAAVVAEEIVRPVAYRPVETGGAARAAALLAELL
jgi:UDP:flavonoid glycosyltransferase YjiC (YdhE family)